MNDEKKIHRHFSYTDGKIHIKEVTVDKKQSFFVGLIS